MAKLLLVIAVFVSLLSYSQEIPSTQSCDVISLHSMQLTEIKAEHLPCTFPDKDKFQLFTSLKQFHSYYKEKKNEFNEGCYSLFKKFDFKKNDLLVIHYELEPDAKASVEVRKSKEHHTVFLKIINKISPMPPMPRPYHKYISLPKSTSNIKPEIIVCYSNE
jgi:hypothetical protein